MHIIGMRKFSCIYQIVKEVDFFQLKKSDNPFKTIRFNKTVYFQATIVVYRSGYLGVLRVTLKMHIKHASQKPMTDFRLVTEHAADTHTLTTDNHLQQGYPCLFSHLNWLILINLTVFLP